MVIHFCPFIRLHSSGSRGRVKGVRTPLFQPKRNFSHLLSEKRAWTNQPPFEILDAPLLNQCVFRKKNFWPESKTLQNFAVSAKYTSTGNSILSKSEINFFDPSQAKKDAGGARETLSHVLESCNNYIINGILSMHVVISIKYVVFLLAKVITTFFS